MAYQDLGRKIGGPVEPAQVSEKDSKPRITYPSFYINTSEAIDAKADQVIECKVKLRCKGFRKDDYGPNDKPYSNDFDVMAIDFGDNGPQLEDDEDDEEEGAAGIQNALEKGLKKKASEKAPMKKTLMDEE